MRFLFSYGSLQHAEVQLSTFGRRLQGQPDELVGFEPTAVRIEAPEGGAATGKTHHANVIFNGSNASRVSGTVFEVTNRELASADEYERRDGYERVAVRLASGRNAWVYLSTRSR
jgi:hypothetical protein